MKTKTIIAILLLALTGYFYSCTGMELESQTVENEKIATRTMGFPETSRFYYYYGNERQYLQLNTRYMFVSVADESIADVLASRNIRHQPLSVDIPAEMQQSTMSQAAVGSRTRLYTVLSLDEAMSEEAYLTKLSEISNLSSGIIVAPYFKNRYFDRIGLSNFFYVKLRSLNDIDLLKQKAEEKQATLIYQNELAPLWWVLSVTENSTYNAMEMANHFHRSGLFRYAAPDLMVANIDFLTQQRELGNTELFGATNNQPNCANDQHFGVQWGLKNTGQSGGRSGVDINICNAWQLSTGHNVIVAVVDNGLDFDNPHPDLRENILFNLSFDTESGTSPQRLPPPRAGYIAPGSHGTSVAGIIAAVKNNDIGIAGVAPHSRIMSISNALRDDIPLTHQRKANGIRWAAQNGADVINNSWFATSTPVITDAINYAVTRGRNGRGSVVIVASGNVNSSTVNFPSSLPTVMAVGAVNRYGQRWHSIHSNIVGSNFGTALDIVAPGVTVRSTAIGGGYRDITNTSHAAPHVAGVAALILKFERARSS